MRTKINQIHFCILGKKIRKTYFQCVKMKLESCCIETTLLSPSLLNCIFYMSTPKGIAQKGSGISK